MVRLLGQDAQVQRERLVDAPHAEQALRGGAAAIPGSRSCGVPAVLVADPSKALRVLGWQTRHSGPDNIVRSAWNWHNGRRAAADA